MCLGNASGQYEIKLAQSVYQKSLCKMQKACSICMVETPYPTPILRLDSEIRDTGLSKMVEMCNGVELDKSSNLSPIICNNCIYNIVTTYYENNLQTRKSNTLAPHISINKSDYIMDFESQSTDCSIKTEHQIPLRSRRDMINALDYDCLSQIFSYLPLREILQSEEVCQRWKAAVEFIWHKYKKIDAHDFKPWHDWTQSDVEELLKRTSPYLAVISLPPICNSRIVPILRKYCHNITELNLQLTYVHEYNFLGAFENMKNLKLLNIRVEETRATPVDHSLIFRSLPDAFSDLIISSDHNNTFGNLNHYFAMALDRLKNLRCLKLIGCKLDCYATESISRKKTLSHIKLSNCKLQEGTLNFIFNDNLEFLELDKTKYIDRCLRTLSSECKNIKKLNIQECETSELSLTYMGNLENIEYINVNSVKKINDYILFMIIEKCKYLKHLNLGKCFLLSEGSLLQLCSLKKLEYLDVSYLNYIDDNIIITIADNCTKLTHLSIDSCRYVTLDGMKKLIERYSQFQVLNVYDTLFNLEMIYYAIEVMKKRTSHNVLTLVVLKSLLIKFNESIDTSTYVKVTTR